MVAAANVQEIPVRRHYVISSDILVYLVCRHFFSSRLFSYLFSFYLWVRSLTVVAETPFQSREQSYITSDGQSVSKSWCPAQSGTFDQRYIYIFLFLNVTVLSYLGHALSREVGSVICQSFVNIVCSSLSIYMHNLHFVVHTFHN
jgi:hypothetical protein